MSNLFNASLDIQSYDYINEKEWSISARVIDNTGNYIANNVQVGDIIYINGLVYGSGVLRYRVTSISRASGTTLEADIMWDKEITDDSYPVEPLIGYEAVIGAASTNLKLASLTSGADNNIGESFITAIKNYENFEIIDKAHGSGTGNRKKYIAGENIEPFKVLYLVDNINVAVASCYNIDCADKIVGISLEAANVNEEIEVQIGGNVHNDDWDIDYSGPIFIGRNGELAKLPSADGAFIEQLGLSVGNSTIDIDMEEAIII